MFAAHCVECDRTYLVSTHSIEALYSIEPGVVVVELTCLRGHPVTVLSGNATAVASAARDSSKPVSVAVPLPRSAEPIAGSDDAPAPDRVPRAWSSIYTERPGLLARAYARVAAFLNVQAWMFRRFDYRTP